MRHPAFLSGAYDTGFIDRYRAALAPASDDESTTWAAIGAALAARRASSAQQATDGTVVLDTSRVTPSAWRQG
jgi:acetyl/propionyl-CoA carboxylase alpha subunit